MVTLQMLKIYGRAASVNVQRLLWAVEEAIAYERFDRGGKYGGIDGAEFGAMNPHRKIPTIDDEGVVVWESNAMIRYLATSRPNTAPRPYGPTAWRNAPTPTSPAHTASARDGETEGSRQVQS